MFRRILTTALLAGFLGGLGISAVQQFTTAPLIRLAEEFESKATPGAHKHGFSNQIKNPLLHLVDGKDAYTHETNAWAPEEGLERAVYSTLANILTGIGFALILVACIALSGRRVDGRSGVLWGIAGFTVINLAPSLGLPPEIPGAMVAELGARQGWWLLCVAATAAGLWMLIFRHGAIWMGAGLALIALPHVFGAPHPTSFGGVVPAELAGQFVAASMVTAAIFWCSLGWLSGTFWQRSGGE